MFLLFRFFALKKKDMTMIFKSTQVNESSNTSWMCPDEHWIWFRLESKSYHQFEKLITFQNRIETTFLSFDDVVDLDSVSSFFREDESLPIRIEKQNIKSHVLIRFAFFHFLEIAKIDWQFRSLPFHFEFSFTMNQKKKWSIESCQCSYQI